MFKPLPAFIGFRYTKAKRDNNYISFISVASVIGIALGVMVLITVLSIVNGYIKGIQDRHLGMLSHVTVSDSDWSLPNWSDRKQQVLENNNVTAVAPFIERQVMLKEGDKVHPAMVQAILPEHEKNIGTINRYIEQEKGLELLSAGEFKIILGELLANTLDVKVGDSVTLLSPKQKSFLVATDDAQSTDDLIPIIKEFVVAATFKVDLQMYDKSYAYIHMSDAAELFDLDTNVSGLRVQIKDMFKAQDVTNEIASQSSGDYVITNWTSQLFNFYRALQLFKTMLFLVLLLIIGVAAFNLISTLIMVVTDKESDIAILRTLGMSPAQVMKIFIIQGGLLALIGTFIGVVLGILIASNVSAIVQFLESLLNTNFLNADIHELTQIDAKIQISDVILIAISAFILSVAATIFPAWKASKVQPATALRYE